MIQKIILIFLLPILFVSCSDDDSQSIIPIVAPQLNCKITGTSVATLTFDDIKIEGYNSTFSEKLHFDYDEQGRVVRTRGGLKAYNDLSSLAPKWAFHDDINDTIMYDNGIISVKYSNNSNLRPYDKEFTIINGTIQSRKVISYTGNSTTPVIYTYEYTATGVVEKKDNVVYRTFTIENGNLTKVERLSRNYLTGEIFAKEEILFGDYDTAENWLKGKFYINGAFLELSLLTTTKRLLVMNIGLKMGNMLR